MRRLILGVLIAVVSVILLVPGAINATESPLYTKGMDRPCEPGELSVLCSPVSTPVTSRPPITTVRDEPSALARSLAYQKFCRILWITWHVKCP